MWARNVHLAIFILTFSQVVSNLLITDFCLALLNLALSVPYVFTHFILTTALWGHCYLSHFTDEEAETQRT